MCDRARFMLDSRSTLRCVLITQHTHTCAARSSLYCCWTVRFIIIMWKEFSGYCPDKIRWKKQRAPNNPTVPISIHIVALKYQIVLLLFFFCIVSNPSLSLCWFGLVCFVCWLHNLRWCVWWISSCTPKKFDHFGSISGAKPIVHRQHRINYIGALQYSVLNVFTFTCKYRTYRGRPVTLLLLLLLLELRALQSALISCSVQLDQKSSLNMVT